MRTFGSAGTRPLTQTASSPIEFASSSARGLEEVAEGVRLEDRSHFELIVSCIYERGGTLPDDIRGFPNPASRPDLACPPLVGHVRGELPKAELCMIHIWPKVTEVPWGRPRICDLTTLILDDEIDSRSLRSGEPGEAPFRRTTASTVPGLAGQRTGRSSLSHDGRRVRGRTPVPGDHDDAGTVETQTVPADEYVSPRPGRRRLARQGLPAGQARRAPPAYSRTRPPTTSSRVPPGEAKL